MAYGYDSGYSSEERLISEFNEAKFQIYRLHNIWVECRYLREKGKLISWRWRLDTAMIELWNDAERLDGNSEKKYYTTKLRNLNKEVAEKLKEKNLEKLYNKLMEKEIFLREIQEKAGKGAKFRPADDDYM